MADEKKRNFSRVQSSWAKDKNVKISSNISQNKIETMNIKYQEDQTPIRKRPDDITITEDGEYVLSSTENGISKIRLIRNFIDQSNADWMFEQLRNELPWQVRVNKKYNNEEPRLSCWIGEHPYVYSGVSWPAMPLFL